MKLHKTISILTYLMFVLSSCLIYIGKTEGIRSADFLLHVKYYIYTAQRDWAVPTWNGLPYMQSSKLVVNTIIILCVFHGLTIKVLVKILEKYLYISFFFSFLFDLMINLIPDISKTTIKKIFSFKNFSSIKVTLKN